MLAVVMGVEGDATASVKEAVWVSEPETPFTVMVVFPGKAPALAESENWPKMPGERERVAGVAVTPDGSPLRVAVTLLEKLLTAEASTVTVCESPLRMTVTVDGPVWRVKSGVGAAGVEPPPQPTMPRKPPRVPQRMRQRVNAKAPETREVIIECPRRAAQFD